MTKLIITLVFFQLLTVAPTYGMDVDAKLALVKQVYRLAPKLCGPPEANEKTRIVGKALFESVSLSGDRDTSCASCHLDRFGSADGLPLAAGVGSVGEGLERYQGRGGTLVQRNTFSLKGRGSRAFTAFFWDGKAQFDGDRIVTQFGDQVDGKFSNLLAAAAILPIIERDEFMGKTSYIEDNDIQYEASHKLYFERYMAVSKALKVRFGAPTTDEDQKVAKALTEAGVNLEDLELAHIGNLISEFISGNFPCETSPWDRYLAGDNRALSNEQKEGAVLFYGKGRCASCHSGEMLSDFSFHSIGSPQGSFGPHSRHRDIGRAGVTHNVSDLYLFRTPPLIGVVETPPYGHSGAFANLTEVVVHHFNPLSIYVSRPDYTKADKFVTGKLLQARDSVLATIDISSDEEVERIVEFLEAL
jgi:cytochrome c peroxidase